MNTASKARFQIGLEIYLRKSISLINATCKRKGLSDFFVKTRQFKYQSGSYGYEETEIFSADLIASLYCYNWDFIFQEGRDLAQLIIDEYIFNRIKLATGWESVDPETYIKHYLIRILEDYCTSVGKYQFSKRKFNFFFRALIEAIEDDHFICELVFILPNLEFPDETTQMLFLEDWFFLKKPSNKLKETIINSFNDNIFHTWSINYDLVLSTEIIMRKVVKVKKSEFEKWAYIPSFWGTHSGIQKEIKNGIEMAKKISICQGKMIRISNAFYRWAPSLLLLDSIDWCSDPNFDFPTPNLIRMDRSKLRWWVRNFNLLFKKITKFHFHAFPIPVGRYLSALDKERKDFLNAVVDYIILLESLLLDTKNEISFQFSLFWSLFFAKNRLQKAVVFMFFKKLYALRSDLVHGNDEKAIKNSIAKLIASDPDWFAKLKNYSHGLILFLIEKNVESKAAFLAPLQEKLHK